MFKSILDFFNAELTPGESDSPEHRLRLAASALMIEVSRADHQRDAAENRKMESLLRERFHLTEDELTEMIKLAEAENRAATSLYQFTRLINDHYSDNEKYQLIEMLWEIAAADDNISKYEDHLIRKVAELIHLPHRAFIQAKHAVLGQ